MAESRRAYFNGDGVIVFRDLPVSALLDGEVRLEVNFAALCGSDKRLYQNGSQIVPGHEIAGTISEVGPQVRNFKAGQRCIVYMPVYCGQCDCCLNGLSNGCLRLRDLIGWQRDGGFATTVDLPARCVIPVPTSMPLDLAILALDTVGTAAHALRWAARAKYRRFAQVAVIGCGPLGLGAVAVAQAMGLPAPYVYDPHQGRCRAAVALGANVLAQDEGAEFDLVIEASGASQARQYSQQIARPGGVLVSLGESDDPYVIYPSAETRRKNLTTIRTFYFPISDVEMNWRILQDIGATLSREIVAISAFEHLPMTFRRFLRGDLIKPVVRIVPESG